MTPATKRQFNQTKPMDTANTDRKIAELRQIIAILADAATAQINDGLDRLEWIRKTAFEALDKLQ